MDRVTLPSFDFSALRRRFSRAYIANNGYTPESAQSAIAEGSADLIAFGRAFIANPDYVARVRRGAPLNEMHQETLYWGGAEGYIDYPLLEEQEAG